MSKNQRIKVRLCSLALTIIISSCNKSVTLDPPANKIVTSAVFSNDLSAQAALTSIYSQMSADGFASGNSASITVLGGESADEFKNYSVNPEQIAFFTNGILPSNRLIYSNLWVPEYSFIYQANAILEGLSNNNRVTESTKSELIGEAKFIRAFCHFYLVNLFGDIPLITSTDYQTNSIAKRSSEQLVYQQIISDLKDAQSLLVSDYSFSKGERIRPNKWAATALLARVYLYAQDWKNAEAQSDNVIAAKNLYNLPADLNAVFLKNSGEAIWQLMPISTDHPTGEAASFILTTDPDNISLSDELFNAFEPNDNRKKDWIGSIVTSGGTYHFAYKYKETSSSLTEYSMVLRLSEQYLIRAEARVQQNNIVGAVADLNIIRARARGTAPSSVVPNLLVTITQSDALKAVLHERQVELFTEWAHRWLDMKRTNTVDGIMSIVTPNKGGSSWNSNKKLYPIPQQERNSDPNLSQNIGYN